MRRPELPFRPIISKDLFSFKRNRHPKEKRTIEPIDPIDVVIAERPWDPRGISLQEQLETNVAGPGALPKYLGEGLLMRADTDQLRSVFSAIVKEQGERTNSPWNETEQQLVLDVAEYVAMVHGGQLRKDEFTPYEHHLLRIASRAAQLDIANPYMVAVALLHDAPEDHDITLNDMVRYFVSEKKYDSLAIFNTLSMLFEGADALNNKRGGKELSSRQYYHNINTANDQYPDLHLWAIKGLDRYDNLVSDLSPAIRHQELDGSAKTRRPDAEKIKGTLERKILPIIKDVYDNEPNSGVISLLAEAIRLGAEQINEHGLTLRRGMFNNIARQTRRVLNHVPE